MKFAVGTTVAALWEEFRQASLPADAPQAMIDHLKLTFYCGIHAYIHQVSLLCSTLPRELVKDHLSALIDEVQAFTIGTAERMLQESLSNEQQQRQAPDKAAGN